MMRPKHPFANQVNLVPIFGKKSPELNSGDFLRFVFKNYFWLSATATATATVAPTMELLPMPKKPIISTEETAFGGFLIGAQGFQKK